MKRWKKGISVVLSFASMAVYAEEPNASVHSAQNETVTDLTLENPAPTAPSIPMPMFKTYFDLDFVSRPGLNNGRTDLTFDSYHSFLFFEINPTPDLQFMFDVNPNPRMFELDAQVAPRVQLRAGKIWIPFDDISSQSPHTFFGGRTNTSKIAPGGLTFLPDIWTDLGLGLKVKAIETESVALEAQTYIVNGFGEGGTDPKSLTTDYPQFSNIAIGPDNNRDKAFGFRTHSKLFGQWGLGASLYRGRWSNEELPSAGITLVGIDAQWEMSTTEFRLGWASMKVGLTDSSSFVRNGSYAEVGQKLGSKQQWKVLARGGAIQLDSRTLASNDQQIIGGAVLFRPGLIQYSVEHSRDVRKLAGKSNYSYTALRLIIAF